MILGLVLVVPYALVLLGLVLQGTQIALLQLGMNFTTPDLINPII